MGFFSYMYLIQADITKNDEIYTKTTVFGAEPEKDAYFSWMPGERLGKIFSYGDGTIFGSVNLIV